MADEIKNATDDFGEDIANTIPEEKPKRKRTVKKSDDSIATQAENDKVKADNEKNGDGNDQEKAAQKRKPRKKSESSEARSGASDAEEKPKSTNKRIAKVENKQDCEEDKENDATLTEAANEEADLASKNNSNAAAEEIKESVEIVSESTECNSDTTQNDKEDDIRPPLMNIEHFFDYRASSLTNENAEEADNNDETRCLNDTNPLEQADEEIPSPELSDDIPVIQEYENYTILDEIEELHEKEVRERIRKSKDDAKYDADKPRAVDKKFDMIELFVFTLVIIMLLTTFVFKHSVVDGPSMMNTLQHGDHLIISDLFYKPKQYDLIVFQDFESGYTDPIVKRVIATEGQHVLVESMDTVYVDGKLVPKNFVFIDGEEVQYREELYPFEWDVPEGEVYVMGDHRNASDDSRYFPCKSIKVDSILGKVLFRIYPFDKIGIIKYKPNEE